MDKIPEYRRKRVDEDVKFKKKPLVEDGVGKYLETCKLCGKNDLVFPLNSTITICPRCLRKTNLHHDEVKLIKVGKCALCDKPFVGAGVEANSDIRVCYKCLWNRLGKKTGHLKIGGERIA